LALVASGWESALARYKRAKEFAKAKPRQQTCTVGDFLDEVFRTACNQRTVEGYTKAFRQIVSQSFGLESGTDKYDYHHGGQSKWLEKVDRVKLAEVTPARVQEWKRPFLASAGNDPLELRRARISVNSLLRQARSLFATK
jgi:hypothetical protein